VAERGLVDGQLVAVPTDGVAPSGNAVGPGYEELPASARADLIGREAIEDRASGDGVFAQGRANGGNDGALVSPLELDLLSR
jgi:hypothetical protein